MLFQQHNEVSTVIIPLYTWTHETERSYVTCPASQNWEMADLDFEAM